MRETHGGSDFRLIDDTGIKLSSEGQCLMFVIGWPHHGSTAVFLLLCLSIYQELFSLFKHSIVINLIVYP